MPDSEQNDALPTLLGKWRLHNEEAKEAVAKYGANSAAATVANMKVEHAFRRLMAAKAATGDGQKP